MSEERDAEPTTECPNGQSPRNFFTWQLTDPLKVERYLWGLSFANCTAQFEQEFYGAATASYGLPTVQESDDLKVSAVMCCSSCGAEFDSRDEQVQHYKGDWHRYNLKQQLRGRLPLSEEAFLDTIDEISSISGSESETGNDSTTEAGPAGAHSPRRDANRVAGLQRSPKKASRDRSASVTSTDTEGEETDQDKSDGKKSRMNLKLYLKNGNNQVLALYRCIVHGKMEVPLSHKELIVAVSEIPQKLRWAVVMVGGGHFAAAICDRGNVVAHKTFHRYTVRAKQGGAQSSRDGKQKGSQPKSAGASLRRHNEAALVKDIQDLLSSWSEDLQKCSAIFYRAPGASRTCLFSGKSAPLKKSDPRLRSIPFPTKRATYNEVLRVHRLLATVECFGSEANIDGRIPVSPKIHSGSKKPSKSPKGLNQNNEAEVLSVEPLGNTEKVSTCDNESALSESDREVVFELTEEPISTLGLREFASTRRRPKSRHKKGRSSSGRTSSEPSLPKEYHALRTAMLEACKSGNLDALSSILKVLTQKNNVTPESVAVHAPDKMATGHDTELHTRTESHGSSDEHPRCDNVRPSDKMTDKNDTDSSTLGPADVYLEIGNHEKELRTSYCSKDDPPTPQNEHDPKGLMGLGVREGKGDPTVHLALKAGLPAGRLLSPTGSDPEATPLVEKVIEWDQDTDKVLAEPASLDACCDVVCKKGLKQKLLDAPLDDSSATLLHYCARHGFGKLVTCLMEAGADLTVKNSRGQTPYAVTSDKQTRHEFRRFRAANPDKYDYNKAQIPSGLTEEMEKERNIKHAEKQKEKRKLHREKLKERKAAELQRQKEEAERQRFLSLSDREKRALAAERRFAQQLLATNAPHVVLSRCFMCATDITGKVPFEYNDSKFCSIDCVKLHRQKPSGTRQ
ncbi:tRNA endonuclease ANKZF1-like isoform X2 [Ornithodoros turicata]